MKNLLLYLFSLLLLCQCVNNPSGKTLSEKDMSDVIAELDIMVNQFIKENGIMSDEVFSWEADTLVADCYVRALTAISKKYGEESEEALTCLQYVADSLLNDRYPFSRKTQVGYSCYEKALNISIKMYGDTSIAVGKCYANMVYACGQDCDDAQLYADSALAILEPRCGYSSEEVADVYRYLGISYQTNTHYLYRVAAQSQMVADSEYFSVNDYEEINSTLESSLANYRKALDIYKEISEKNMDDYRDVMESLKEDIQSIEDELKENHDILARIKRNPPKK